MEKDKNDGGLKIDSWGSLPNPIIILFSSLSLFGFLKQEILCIALDVLEFTMDTCRLGWPPVQKLARFCLPASSHTFRALGLFENS